MDNPEKESVLYDLGTDGVCEFQDGTSIRINRTMLAVQSKFFMIEFFGPARKTNVKIDGFDRDTFKLFLDCLFGIKEYSILDALLIYPIAHQYDAKKSLRKCTAVLEPKEMNENVCLTLNLALFYKSDDLVAKLIDFIESEIGIIDLMEDQKYRSLLEPVAVSELIKGFEFNSFVVELIYDWGEGYLKERGRSVDINVFLKDNEMLSKLQLSDFESVQSVLKFVKTSNWTVFYKEDVLCFLESKLSQLGKVFPNQSEWVNCNGNGSIKEIITYSKTSAINGYICFEIFVNKIFIGNKSTNGKPCLNVRVERLQRTVSSNSSNSRYARQLIFPEFAWELMEGLENEPLNFLLSPEKPAHSSTIEIRSWSLLEVKAFEITYNFTNFHNCRILKTSLSNDYENSDNLYFTKNVVLSEIKY